MTEESVPPVTETSPVAKFEDASDNVIVKVDVSPDFSVVALAAIETVGTRVSYVKFVFVLAELLFPAASVKKPLRTNA